MMLMTIMSSRRVKPLQRPSLLRLFPRLAEVQLAAGDVASNVSTNWFGLRVIYQSLYFVPSRPVPCDLV